MLVSYFLLSMKIFVCKDFLVLIRDSFMKFCEFVQMGISAVYIEA